MRSSCFARLFVSEGDKLWTSSFWMIFLVLHICMYGGANSLNSYYDKDEGPIGGLERPPPVDDSTFYLSWASKYLFDDFTTCRDLIYFAFLYFLLLPLHQLSY
jgi:hypothetical protein